MNSDLSMLTVRFAYIDLGESAIKATAAILELQIELRWLRRQRRRAYAMKIVTWRRRNLRRTGRWPA